MKRLSKKIGFLIIVVFIVGFAMFLREIHNKELKNSIDEKNELFTENFFDGLIEINNATKEFSIRNEDDLNKICNILANITLEENIYESNLNCYGGYFYELKYENGMNKKLIFTGISDNRTLIIVDDKEYETKEVVLPQIVQLLENK